MKKITIAKTVLPLLMSGIVAKKFRAVIQREIAAGVKVSCNLLDSRVQVEDQTASFRFTDASSYTVTGYMNPEAPSLMFKDFDSLTITELPVAQFSFKIVIKADGEHYADEGGVNYLNECERSVNVQYQGNSIIYGSTIVPKILSKVLFAAWAVDDYFTIITSKTHVFGYLNAEIARQSDCSTMERDDGRTNIYLDHSSKLLLSYDPESTRLQFANRVVKNADDKVINKEYHLELEGLFGKVTNGIPSFALLEDGSLIVNSKEIIKRIK